MLRWLKRFINLSVVVRSTSFTEIFPSETLHGGVRIWILHFACVYVPLLFLYVYFSFTEIESSPIRCLVSEVKSVACGGEFTAWLSSVQGASLQYVLWLMLSFLKNQRSHYQLLSSMLLFLLNFIIERLVFPNMVNLVMELIMRYAFVLPEGSYWLNIH